MSKYQITNQRDLRRAFWEAFPTLSRKRVHFRLGYGALDYHVDTRCAFVDWIDLLCRDGAISGALAHRATLNRE